MKRTTPELNPAISITLSDDRPLADGSTDWLGLGVVADHLAAVLTQTSLQRGFILGVEGPWGSGKSTVIRLTERRLKSEPIPPEVIVFNPWLIGNRDALLASLFGDIADAIERMEEPTESRVEQLRDGAISVAKRVRSYAVHIGALSKIIDLAGTFVPGASGLGKGLSSLSQSFSKFADAADALPSDRPLSDQKGTLEEALRGLKKPLIVFVDDLERLEPTETIEMIRLIRAVGDLPNLIYVLCYDRDVLVGNIEQALSIEDGARYLEKIVQVSLPLPQPEAFTLRRWFFEECLVLSGLDAENPDDADTVRRLSSVIDDEGGKRLDTPRDVVRALNSLQLYWAPIRDYVDFADLVRIQLIRLKSPKLYLWIERYVTSFAAVALGGAFITKPKRIMRELRRALKGQHDDVAHSMYGLRELLPGLKVKYGADKKAQAEGFNLDRDELKKFTRHRRLGSPHYFRYYFSFGPTSGELHEKDVRALLRDLETRPRVFRARMLELAATKNHLGIALSPIIDRLSALPLNDSTGHTVLAALSDCMDIAFFGDVASFSVKRSWESGERLWDIAFESIERPKRGAVLLAFAKKGKALGWMARSLRHGKYRSHRQHEPVLTEDEIDAASAAFINRIDSDLPIMESAWLEGIFYLWSDVAGQDVAKAKVAERIHQDEAFVRFMHASRSWLSSDRVYRPLRSAEVDHFLNFADARARAEAIGERAECYPEDIRKMIADVSIALEEGDRHPARFKDAA